ncbi:ParA family protein [candidate division KSB1 bacterium]|nr:ParA family protein [candidate division KSB1 bacterium]
MGEIIAIVSQKGGVGKTTTAVNLCASLSYLKHKVLLIDLDPQGHVATSFGKGKYDINGDFYSAMSNGANLSAVIHSTGVKGYDFIPSNVESDEDDKKLYIAPLREKRLKHVLTKLQAEYDYILIDCPPALGNVTCNALVASTSIIVPIQCEFYALKSLGKLLKLTRTIKKLYNPDLEYKGFLLTMVDLRNNLSKRVSNKVRYTLKGLVFDTIIPRNIRLAEVPYYGKPAMLFDKRSKGAESYLDLAREMLNHHGTIDSDTSSNNGNFNHVDE